jgi:hypothetical protein
MRFCLASTNRSTQRAARSEPPGLLAGDRGDAVVVLVVVQDRDAGGLGGRRNQEIGVLDGSVVQPALECELLVDVKRAFPLLHADRTVGQCAEVVAQGLELVGVLGAVEQLQPHHVADRDLSVDQVVVEVPAQIATDDAGPRPRTRVRKDHLRELPRAAHGVQPGRRQAREIAFCKTLA